MKTDFNHDLLKFSIEAIIDPNLAMAGKLEVLKKILKLDTEQKVEFLVKLIEAYLGPKLVRLTDNDKKIVKFLQKDIVSLVKQGNKKILELLLDASEQRKTRDVFSEIMAEIISDENVELSQEDIIMLLQRQEPARSTIVDALCVRQKINPAEANLVRFNVKQEDFIFKKKLFVSEKPNKRKYCPNVIAEAEQELKSTLMTDNGQRSMASRNKLPIFSGDSANEKIYIARALCSQENINFVYVDMKKLLNDNKEISALKTSVVSHKPALVYFDNYKEIFDLELDSLYKPKIKIINNHLKEIMLDPVIFPVAGFEDASENFNKNTFYKSIIENNSRGVFMKGPSHDMASYDFKTKMIEQSLAALSEDRTAEFNTKQLTQYLIHETDGFSKLEFMSFMSNYFSYSILGMSKCAEPKDFNNVKTQFETLAVTDERITHLDKNFQNLMEEGESEEVFNELDAYEQDRDRPAKVEYDEMGHS